MAKKAAKKAAKKDELPTVADGADEAHAETATPGFFARLLDQFTTAWLFLTRVPLPSWWNKPEIEPIEDTEAEMRTQKTRLATSPSA